MRKEMQSLARQLSTELKAKSPRWGFIYAITSQLNGMTADMTYAHPGEDMAKRMDRYLPWEMQKAYKPGKPNPYAANYGGEYDYEPPVDDDYDDYDEEYDANYDD